MAVSGLVDADQFLSKMADLPIPDGLSLKGSCDSHFTPLCLSDLDVECH